MGRIDALEVSEVPPAEVKGPDSFSRAPMTFAAIVWQPGVSGYRVPSENQPWLELRLQDGCWLRVRPVDSLLQCYQITPFGNCAVRAGMREEFLAVWAAFIRISRLATNALERAVQLDEMLPAVVREVAEDETGRYTSIAPIDHRPPGTRILDAYSRQLGRGSENEVSVAAGFVR